MAKRITNRQAAALGLAPKRSKYRAVPTEYNGQRYDSKSEARHAAQLDELLAAGVIAWWLRQVPVTLGAAGCILRVDFLVAIPDGDGVDVRGEEIKGAESEKWRFMRKMWLLHGPFPLQVWRGGKCVEILEPRRGD